MTFRILLQVLQMEMSCVTFFDSLKITNYTMGVTKMREVKEWCNSGRILPIMEILRKNATSILMNDGNLLIRKTSFAWTSKTVWE